MNYIFTCIFLFVAVIVIMVSAQTIANAIYEPYIGVHDKDSTSLSVFLPTTDKRETVHYTEYKFNKRDGEWKYVFNFDNFKISVILFIAINIILSAFVFLGVISSIRLAITIYVINFEMTLMPSFIKPIIAYRVLKGELDEDSNYTEE